METEFIEYLVGTVFVGLYSIERINTPKIDLATTTSQRYWSMVLTYALTSVLVYFALSISLSQSVVDVLVKFDIVPQPLTTASSPVLMALLLTVLLSKVPGVSKFDEALRIEFRHRASMSRIAGNLSHLLQGKPLQLSNERQQSIVAYLTEQGINENDIKFAGDKTAPQYLWTRIAVLLDSLRRWESERPFDNFVTTFRGEWEKLIADAERHEKKAIHCFRLGCVDANDILLASALKDCRKHYTEQLNVLLKGLSDFMGRGIAATAGNNPERRRLALQDIGLDVNSDVGYTVHQIAFVMMIALVGAVVFPMLIHLVTHEESTLNRYVFKIAVGYAIAVLVALHFHYRDNSLSSPPSAQRPWGRYLKVGALTVMCTATFSVMLDILAQRDPAVVLTKFWEWSCVYQIRPFVFAVLIAYLVDTRVPQEKLRVRQWTETAIAAVTMAATGATIWLIFQSIKNSHPDYSYHVPDITGIILSAAVIGAILGYWLPTNTRRVAERVLQGEMEITKSPASAPSM